MTGGHAWKYLGGVAFQCKPKKNLLCYGRGTGFHIEVIFLAVEILP